MNQREDYEIKVMRDGEYVGTARGKRTVLYFISESPSYSQNQQIKCDVTDNLKQEVVAEQTRNPNELRIVGGYVFGVRELAEIAKTLLLRQMKEADLMIRGDWFYRDGRHFNNWFLALGIADVEERLLQILPRDQAAAASAVLHLLDVDFALTPRAVMISPREPAYEPTDDPPWMPDRRVWCPLCEGAGYTTQAQIDASRRKAR